MQGCSTPTSQLFRRRAGRLYGIGHMSVSSEAIIRIEAAHCFTLDFIRTIRVIRESFGQVCDDARAMAWLDNSVQRHLITWRI
jgi:hypothetical protein